jgi:hypothetical protein
MSDHPDSDSGLSEDDTETLRSMFSGIVDSDMSGLAQGVAENRAFAEEAFERSLCATGQGHAIVLGAMFSLELAKLGLDTWDEATAQVVWSVWLLLSSEFFDRVGLVMDSLEEEEFFGTEAVMHDAAVWVNAILHTMTDDARDYPRGV